MEVAHPPSGRACANISPQVVDVMRVTMSQAAGSGRNRDLSGSLFVTRYENYCCIGMNVTSAADTPAFAGAGGWPIQSPLAGGCRRLDDW
jgi:hypothetical protein